MIKSTISNLLAQVEMAFWFAIIALIHLRLEAALDFGLGSEFSKSSACFNRSAKCWEPVNHKLRPRKEIHTNDKAVVRH